MDGVTSDLLTSGAAELLHTAWRERERRQGEREKRGGGMVNYYPTTRRGTKDKDVCTYVCSLHDAGP